MSAVPSVFFRFIAILVALMFSVSSALALDENCFNISSLNRSLSAGTGSSTGSDSASMTITLQAGDRVTFSYSTASGGGGIRIEVTNSPGGVDNGTLFLGSGSGSLDFTATVSGSFTIQYRIDGSGPYVVNFAASCISASTSPTTPAGDEGGITDANDRALDKGRLGSSPKNLPGTSGVDNSEKIQELKRKLQELEEEEKNLSESIKEDESRRQGLSGGYVSSLLQFFIPFDTLEKAVEDLRARRAKNFAERILVRARIEELGGDPDVPAEPEDFTPDDPEDLGDGDEILYFPRSAGPSGLNNVSAYNAITAASDGVQARFVREGELLHLWSRVGFSAIDGSLGRTGLAGNVQVGVVKAISPHVDLGGFVSGFSGSVNSSSLNSSTGTLGLGVGAYVKFALDENLDGGVSAFYERSNSNINIGGVTGSYARDLVSMDASLSGQYEVGVVDIAPSANLNWTYSNRNAYTNSASVAVPASINNQISADASVVISRTFLVLEGKLHSITPRIGSTVTFNAVGLDTINLSGGNSIVQSRLTGALDAGVDMDFVGGGAVNLNLGVSGIGGSTRSYSASIGLNFPIKE